MKKKLILGIMALSLTLTAPCAVFAQDASGAVPATSEGIEAEDAIEIPEYTTADYAEAYIFPRRTKVWTSLKRTPAMSRALWILWNTALRHML